MTIKGLSRTASHRKALMRNLTSSLIEYESITTTLAKAKRLRSFAEKVISFTKNKDQEAGKRLAQAKLYNVGTTLPKLFNVLGPRYAGRDGGYTRILRLEPRISDRAPNAIIELVDGQREMKWWLVAKTVARLQKQGLPLDAATKDDMERLIRFKPDGEQSFNETVEKCKELFFQDPESYALKPEKLVEEFPKKEKKNVVVMPRPSQ